MILCMNRKKKLYILVDDENIYSLNEIEYTLLESLVK